MARGRHGQDDDNMRGSLRNETARTGAKAHDYRSESQCTRDCRHVPQGVPLGKGALSGQGGFYSCQPQRGVLENQEQQLGLYYPHTRSVRQDTPVVRDDDRDIHGRTGRCGAQFGGAGAVHHALSQRQDAGGTGKTQAEPHGHASGVANENQ